MGRETFSLTLVLGHGCNLRCAYCYARRAAAGEAMGLEVAAAAVALGLGRLGPGGRLVLGFFGGEPLLHLDRLVAAAKLAAAAAAREGKTVHPCLTTNGTLLGPAAAAALRAMGAEVTVSVDGTRAAHDRQRVGPDGRGSFDEAMAGLRAALGAGLDPGVNLVLHPATVGDLAAGVDALLAEGVARLDLSPDYGAAWTRDDLAVLAAQYGLVAARYEGRRAAGRPFALSTLDAKLAAAAAGGIPAGCRCAPGERELAVAPDGSLYPCERMVGAGRPVIGRVPGGVDEAALAGLRARRAVRPAACASCSVAAYCVNDCACTNLCRTGDPGRPDGLVCATETMAVRLAERLLSRAFAGGAR